MARGDRKIGLVFGLGAIGAGLVLARRAVAATARSPREAAELPSGGITRFPMLVERWRGEIARRAGDLPVDALLEWIQIESGGDMCSTGTSREAGIWQLSFPADAKYGATLVGLRAICEKSKHQDPADISWLSSAELDMEVGAGVRKVAAARDEVRRVFSANAVAWPEGSFDFGSAVKQVHAAPAVISELVPKITHRDGPPPSWRALRTSVMAFPVAQMGAGLQALAHAPSRHGLANRLEDTLNNAEYVGRAWGSPLRAPGLVSGYYRGVG